MGEFAAKAWGYPGKPPLTLDQSVEGVIEQVRTHCLHSIYWGGNYRNKTSPDWFQIDKANRENMSGKFISYDGTSLQW